MAPVAPKILVIEDDARIRIELLEALRGEGYEVQVAATLEAAKVAVEHEFDLLLLDLGLPDGDGLDLCRALRSEGRSVAILIVTARDAPDQRVRGLDVGADDYLVKPFHMPELLARVRSLLRRAGRAVGLGPVRLGELWADPDLRVAGAGAEDLELKRREFDLLLFLLQHPGRPWTREQLLDRVWGADFAGDARTVDVHVRRLREKIEPNPSSPRLLVTEWGVGYRMQEPA